MFESIRHLSQGEGHGLAEDDLVWLVESTFLATLPPDEQKFALSQMTLETLRRGQPLISAGEPGRGAYLIVSGQAVVYARDKHGARVPVAHPGPGSLVGEGSVITGESARLDVVAGGALRALYFPRDKLREFYAVSPQLKRYLNSLVELRRRWPELLELLSQNPFLRALGRDDAERLLASSQLERPARGEKLLHAGDEPDAAYFVVRGESHVLRPGVSPPERIKTLRRGELVGELALLRHCARTADVVVDLAAGQVGRPEVLRIPGTAFMDILDRNPLLRRRLDQAAPGIVPSGQARLRRQRRPTVFVCGAAPRVGATTVAYGLAGALAESFAVTLVDLEGPKTAARLGCRTETDEVEGLTVGCLDKRSGWPLRVMWPAAREDTLALIEALSASTTPEDSLVVVTGHLDRSEAWQVLESSEWLVHVRMASEDWRDLPTRRGQVRLQAVRTVPGVPLPLATNRKTCRFPADVDSVHRFYLEQTLEPISGTGTSFGRACRRLGRLVRGRSVGVALGGGGAFGYAHIGLLRALREEGITPDFVSGASFGALVGALYVGGGHAALEELLERGTELLVRCTVAMAWPRALADFVDRITGGVQLGDTEVAFYPVGLDLTTGSEHVVSSGTLGRAVQSASCIPGAFPAMRVGTARLVDGGLVNNVPVSTLWDAGADFLLGSNIVPPRAEGAKPPLGNRGWVRRIPLLGPLVRLDDVLRALYGLMSQNGRDRAALADYLFDLSLEGYDIYDFPRGSEIERAGYDLARAQMPTIQEAYQSDATIRF